MSGHIASSDPGPLPAGFGYGIVIACRRSDGRWLCIRRSQFVRAPLKVCFPGGMIEEGETAADAAVREMFEELGVRVRPVRHVWTCDVPQRQVRLLGWLAELPPDAKLQPQEMEVAEVLWLTGQEVAEHPDGLETNRQFVEALESSRIDG